MRRRSDGFQPLSDYFESRQEAPTGPVENSPSSDPRAADSGTVLGTARSSRRLGASINCSPIAPRAADFETVEDTASWKSVFDQLKSEPRKGLADSTPLHEKLRELLDENSRSFDRLRSSGLKSEVLAQASRIRSSSRQREEKSSSISFRPGSSRLSRGAEPPPPVCTRPPSVNVFETSDPKSFIEVEDAPEPPPAAPPARGGRRAAKLRAPSPPADEKKTVKTKTGVSAAPRRRGRVARNGAEPPRIQDLESELKGVVLVAEVRQTGRYARRRHYAPLLDFLFENVTRAPAGELRLQIADLKARPKAQGQRGRKKPTVPPTQLDGIIVDCTDEDDQQVVYRLRLPAGQQKAPAVAQLPVRLRAEGRMKQCLAVSVGPSVQALSRTLLSGGQTAEVGQGLVYALENTRGRGFAVTLTVTKRAS